ncbi:hypothetical protein HDU87_003791 [Geranomyces variabilis]|uniref:Uncharacterized protein n=1 Tax=Geranomyces variabilis TaxID=109894 RepID=A0AAD5TKM3_9FUNG|nr:hypothetical protein HDU87_003791 [Geranomyces variabilis]
MFMAARTCHNPSPFQALCALWKEKDKDSYGSSMSRIKDCLNADANMIQIPRTTNQLKSAPLQGPPRVALQTAGAFFTQADVTEKSVVATLDYLRSSAKFIAARKETVKCMKAFLKEASERLAAVGTDETKALSSLLTDLGTDVEAIADGNRLRATVEIRKNMKADKSHANKAKYAAIAQEDERRALDGKPATGQTVYKAEQDAVASLDKKGRAVLKGPREFADRYKGLADPSGNKRGFGDECTGKPGADGGEGGHPGGGGGEGGPSGGSSGGGEGGGDTGGGGEGGGGGGTGTGDGDGGKEIPPAGGDTVSHAWRDMLGHS